MATSFRRPFIVLKRSPGKWIDGEYYPNEDTVPVNVACTIQEASPTEIDAMNFGRRASHYVKVYTDERLNAVSQQPNGSPGDIIVYDNRNYLIVAESDFTMLRRSQPNTRVAHYRYFAAHVIEHGDYEKVP